MSEIVETHEVKTEKFVDTEDMRFLNVKVSWKNKTKPISEIETIIEKSFNEQGYIFQRLEDRSVHVYWQLMVNKDKLRNRNNSHDIISDIKQIINFSPSTEKISTLSITSSDKNYLSLRSCF